MNQEFQIPLKKVSLAYPFVEAIEVTAQFVQSLPNAGAALQRFGEQVEILQGRPVPKKTYAGYGEYIVRFLDANGVETFSVLSAVAFKALFVDYQEPESGEEGDHGASQYADLAAPQVEEQAPESEEKLSKKEQKRRERLKELASADIDALEKPLDEEKPDSYTGD